MDKHRKKEKGRERTGLQRCRESESQDVVLGSHSHPCHVYVCAYMYCYYVPLHCIAIDCMLYACDACNVTTIRHSYEW